MDRSTALALRMRSLLLRFSLGSVASTVEWFGAMQAQDVNSGLWSLGVRLPGVDVAAALERREAIRTWPMRGTVHWVPPADARWMLELMGVRALARDAQRREQLGLSVAEADKAVELLGSALTGGKRLTRAECLVTLAEGGIPVGGQRGYHLLWYASQQGVTAIAPHVGKDQTFVLLDEWAPAPNRPDRDEALGIIALRYFRSHGPTTRKDFAGWTGLTLTDCKTGIAVAGDALKTVDVEGVEMLMASADPAPIGGGPAVRRSADGGPASAGGGPASGGDGPGVGRSAGGGPASGGDGPGVGRSAGGGPASGGDGPASGGGGSAVGRSAGGGPASGGGASGRAGSAVAAPASALVSAAEDDWLALPGFDEYLLGYKDRSMMATPEQLAGVIPGGNGVFQSTLVRGGKVVATWKRTIGRRGVTVTVLPLVKFTSRDRHKAEAALQPFADFLGLPMTVKNP
jgi:hypothetical protein